MAAHRALNQVPRGHPLRLSIPVPQRGLRLRHPLLASRRGLAQQLVALLAALANAPAERLLPPLAPSAPLVRCQQETTRPGLGAGRQMLGVNARKVQRCCIKISGCRGVASINQAKICALVRCCVGTGPPCFQPDQNQCSRESSPWSDTVKSCFSTFPVSAHRPHHVSLTRTMQPPQSRRFSNGGARPSSSIRFPIRKTQHEAG